MNLSFVKINSENTELLQSFLDSLNEETKTFRYFKSRDISIIRNHLHTLLLQSGSQFIGYGHLDQEQNRVWLGLVVKKEHQGKGIGTAIMNELIKQAKLLKIRDLSLTVDKDNIHAIKLYEKFGFKFVSENNHHKLYTLALATV